MNEVATYLFLYCEYSPNKKGLRYLWYDLTGREQQNDGSRLKIDESRLRRYKQDGRKGPMEKASPGQVFTIEVNKKSVFPSTLKFVKLWQNDDDRRQWRLLNDAAIDAMKPLKETEADLFESLNPIRETILQARTSRERRLIVARVLEYLTSV